MKKQGWEGFLYSELLKAEKRRFSWGRHDCCLWVGNVIKKITGKDIAAPFRGKYKTEMGAKIALKKYGGGDLVTYMDSIMDRIPVKKAQRGDVVLHEMCDMPGLALCLGHKFACPAGNVTGLGYFDMKNCTLAWETDSCRL